MFYSKVGVFLPAFCLLNPLTAEGDQHQYIYTRIKNMIT